MRRSSAVALSFLALTALSAGKAGATPLTANQILQQFNLVVFSDVTSNSETEGRAFVGGNLKGNSSTYDTRTLPASSYAALTVGGNIATSGYVNVNNSGNVVVGGNVTNMNLNGGSAQIGGSVTGNVNGTKTTGASVSIPNFQPTLSSLSTSLSLLSANSFVSIASNTANFSAAPDSTGLAVFDITDSNFFTEFNQISFALNSATTVIINVSVPTATIAANFLAGAATMVAPNVIWNFFDATQLTFNTEFGGTVLATGANVTSSADIDGTLVANSFTQNGEMHQYQFTGTIPPGTQGSITPIPEPSSLGIVGMLLAGLGLLYRRRAA